VGTHAVPGKPNLGSPVDLVTRVNGLYRILDLTSETGSGGLGTEFKLLPDELSGP
jgi:hypothetical protein